MAKQKLDFNIVPIFNQNASGIWYDFIRIEAVCDTELYGLSYPTESIIQSRFRAYKGACHEHKHTFAFGAYHNGQMIGFSQGRLYQENEMYLDRLYVLPKYHRCGIGTQLLKAAEQTATIFATKIKFIALEEAASFYEQKHGYQQFAYMEKNLSPTANSIVPIFQWIKKDFNIKIDIHVNTMELKRNKYQPIFAHINENREIDAVATRTPDGKTKTWANYNIPLSQSKPYRDELLQTLSKTK
jgi:GNAT superfamily N-acetyltransferase